MKGNKIFLLIFVFVMFFGFVDGISAEDYHGVVCSYVGGRTARLATNPDPYTFPFVYTIKVECKNTCKDIKVDSYGLLRGADAGFHEINVSNAGDIENITKDNKKEFGFSSGKGLKKCPDSISFEGKGFNGMEDYNDLITIAGSDSIYYKDLLNFGNFSYGGNVKRKEQIGYYKGGSVDIKQATRDILEGKKVEYHEGDKTTEVDDTKEREKKKKQEESGKNVEYWLPRVLDGAGKYKSDNKYNKVTCSSLLGDENIKLVRRGLFIIAVIGVVLVVALGSSDFVKAVASSDSDALSKAGKSFKNRIISVVLLLLMPVLVDLLLSFINGNVYFRKINSDGSVNNNSKVEI